MKISSRLQYFFYLLFFPFGIFSQATDYWTWISGDSAINQYGTYGTMSIPDPGNKPGGRVNPLSWLDNSGNIWLFGGDGYLASGSGGICNDLWKFNGTNWTWMKGDKTPSSSSFYGKKGVAASANKPRGRRESTGMKDMNGNFWMFGGDAGTSLNDLWKFDGTDWVWMSGDSIAGVKGVYGTKGVPAPANKPGARNGASCWFDVAGNFWLFGGNKSSGSGGSTLNDLWKFDGANWTWVKGDSTASKTGVYGIIGVADSLNKPGGRECAASWMDSNGNLWIFGGLGMSTTSQGELNDLWKFDGTNWTWVAGTGVKNVKGTYGNIKNVSDGACPGGREQSAVWTDASGNFWLFGGRGYDAAGTLGNLNDLWRFDGTYWVWMGGENTTGKIPFHGTKGVNLSSTNPGSRNGTAVCTDAANGHLWLFGGAQTSYYAGRYNSLWKYDLNSLPACTSLTFVSQPDSIRLCEGKSTSFTVSLSGTNPSYQWQVDTGNGFTNIQNSSVYSGSTSAVLLINNTPLSIDSNLYRCVVSNMCSSVTSSVARIEVRLASACLQVWPGDTDNDLAVTNYDLLPIGLFYNQAGTARDSVSNLWIGHSSPAWPQSQLNGVNVKYVDANGDGLVNGDDTLAIAINYAQGHIKQEPDRRQNFLNPDLYLKTTKSSYAPGEWIDFEIWAGDNILPVSKLYGIALNMSFNGTLIESGSMNLFFSNSWLGTLGNNAISLSKVFEGAGKAEGAMTRINHTTSSGYGKIANLVFMAKNSISTISTFTLTFSGYESVDSAGNVKLFTIQPDSVLIIPITTTSGIENVNEFMFSVNPNPFSDVINISYSLKAASKVKLEVLNILGQSIQTIADQMQSTGNYSYALNAEKLGCSKGVYFVKININDQFYSKKIIRIE